MSYKSGVWAFGFKSNSGEISTKSISLEAEYSLRDVNKPIGISEYELTRILPDKLKSSLPSIEEIEEEMSRKLEFSK